MEHMGILTNIIRIELIYPNKRSGSCSPNRPRRHRAQNGELARVHVISYDLSKLHHN
jgi:hypothetical protein